MEPGITATSTVTLSLFDGWGWIPAPKLSSSESLLVYDSHVFCVLGLSKQVNRRQTVLKIPLWFPGAQWGPVLRVNLCLDNNEKEASLRGRKK